MSEKKKIIFATTNEGKMKEIRSECGTLIIKGCRN